MKSYLRVLCIFVTLLFSVTNSNCTTSCHAAEFGVYSETIPGCILYDDPNVNSRIGTYLGGKSSIELSLDLGNKKEGSESMTVVIDVKPGGWAGFFVQWEVEWEREDITKDMSEYDNGYLSFWVKTAIELKVGIRSGNIAPGSEKSEVNLSDYCSIDDQWHDVVIPMTVFKDKEPRLDFTKIKILFNLAIDEGSAGTKNFWIDNVRWIPFYVGDISPNKGLNEGAKAVTIVGEGFRTGAEVKFINIDDSSIILGTNTSVASSQEINTTFDLIGTKHVKWDVEITNPDGQSATLNGGFETRIIKPQGTGIVRISERYILIDEDTYIINGVGYSPTPIGASPPGWKFPDSNSPHIEQQIYDRDFFLLKEMHCNTIRTWGEVTGALLDKAEEYGLKVICGFWVEYGLDLTDPSVQNDIIDNFRAYVEAYKDKDAVLMWSIGNEQNYENGNNPEWYGLVNEMARAAYEVEGDSYHPVTTPNGELNNIGDANMEADDISMNYLDLWGANIYRGMSFGDLFSEYEEKSSKPFWISEYGIDSWDHEQNKENEEEQAIYASDLWDEIVANGNICVGGAIMAYTDEWWKNGDPMSHDPGGYEISSFPDGWSDEEYWGVMRAEDNQDSPDIMRPKVAYYTVQARWGMARSPVVESVYPDVGSNTEDIQVTIIGNFFQGKPNIQLINNAESIMGENIIVETPDRLTAIFSLDQAAPGVWDVVVTNRDGEVGTLLSGFQVTTGIEEDDCRMPN